MNTNTQKIAIIFGVIVGIIWIITAFLPDYTLLWTL